MCLLNFLSALTVTHGSHVWAFPCEGNFVLWQSIDTFLDDTVGTCTSCIPSTNKPTSRAARSPPPPPPPQPLPPALSANCTGESKESTRRIMAEVGNGSIFHREEKKIHTKDLNAGWSVRRGGGGVATHQGARMKNNPSSYGRPRRWVLVLGDHIR